mgnify:CR=1 FL=1|tara:strand:- start:26864 stop:27574 length:711 start_codon:yes stop_codon:yes gene_type:complete
MTLKGKRVVITGASRGIGASIASLFCKNGAKVIGTSTSANTKNKFCHKLYGVNFSYVDEINKFANEIKKIKPDILINNAGTNILSSFVDIKTTDFQTIQQVNVFAPFVFCQAAIPYMKKKRWGRIINISSIWGKIGKSHRASYMSSKFALDGLTLALAAEYAKVGILANCIAPGFTKTDLTKQTLGLKGMKKISNNVPINRLAEPKEIAEFVLWLVTKNTYISGQNITIDGGFTRV